jgi:hypothetical protein
MHAGRLEYAREGEAVIVTMHLLGPAPARGPAAGGLVAWAERTGRGQVRQECRGGLRFAFYGRVPAGDYQDPVTSRTRQRAGCGVPELGHGH